MKRSLIVRIISVVLLSGFIVITFGNGCSNEFKGIETPSTDPLTGSAPGNTTPAPGFDVIPGTKTVSLVYSNQVLSQLSSCVGVAQPSDATNAMYDQKKGAISVYGTADTVTAPMMMSIISIAGEVCNDLINQEIANGNRIFMNMDLKASSLPSEAVLGDAAARLALSCWQRRETSSERTQMMNMVYSSVGASETNASRKAALMLCTSVLSSLDALLN